MNLYPNSQGSDVGWNKFCRFIKMCFPSSFWYSYLIQLIFPCSLIIIQLKFLTDDNLEFIYSQRGHPLLIIDSYLYRKNRGVYWRCIRCTKYQCKSRIILRNNLPPIRIETHSHGPETEKINYGRQFLKNLNLHSQNHQAVILQRQKHCKVDFVNIIDDDEDIHD